jgi:quinate/shikimate dehydrogenase (NAD+)
LVITSQRCGRLELHRVCGKRSGRAVTYDLLVPRDLNLDFDGAFDRAQKEGYRGLNITYPYKETVVGRLAVDDASIKAISACNTVERPRPRGANTDVDAAALRNALQPPKHDR